MISTPLIEILQTYGGWGLSVILMGVIWYQYKEMREMNDKFGDKMDARHQEFCDILAATCELLGRVRETILFCKEKNQ